MTKSGVRARRGWDDQARAESCRGAACTQAYGRGVVNSNAAYTVDPRTLRAAQQQQQQSDAATMAAEEAALAGASLSMEEVAALQVSVRWECWWLG